MVKKTVKNYPNVRVSPETFEILGHLKAERGCSYDAVIRDMLSEFAPFLVSSVEAQYNPNVIYSGDKETILHYNIRLGAKQAYADYWLRVKRQYEDEASAVKLTYHEPKKSKKVKKK